MSSEVIIALAGMISTLIATFIGAIAGYKTAIKSVRLQLEHTDRTRFQEHRLTAYADFLSGVGGIVAYARVNAETRKHALASYLDDLTRFNASHKRIQLFASRDVLKQVRKVHTLTLPFTADPPPTGDALETALNANIKALIDFEKAVRAELGISTGEELMSPPEAKEFLELIAKTSDAADEAK